MSKPFFIPTAKSKPARAGEAIDVAARYFVYKLFEATGGQPGAWHPVRVLGETAATVGRAIERNWVLVRHERKGTTIARCAALTEAGRLMARKGLR